jgi:hypothetical protein
VIRAANIGSSDIISLPIICNEVKVLLRHNNSPNGTHDVNTPELMYKLVTVLLCFNAFDNACNATSSRLQSCSSRRNMIDFDNKLASNWDAYNE